MKIKLMIKFFIFLFAFFSFNAVFALSYSDVLNTHPSFVAINFFSDKGVLQGYSDNTFKPAKEVNRAEALKIIFEGLGLSVKEDFSKNDLFIDVPHNEWFAKYVSAAKILGIVNGNPDGTYAPSRTVSRSEFLKIVLSAIGFKIDMWNSEQLFADVPLNQWFTPYMNYAGKAGIILADSSNNIHPARSLSRAEVSDILYLLFVILKGQDTQFLISQAEAQMTQIELYIAVSDIVSAKKSSELAVDMTQQALKNMPENNVVLGAAKIARSYEYLVNSFISALQKKYEDSRNWANQSIYKATEAWEANNNVQPIARHIKNRAEEILNQIKDL